MPADTNSNAQHASETLTSLRGSLSAPQSPLVHLEPLSLLGPCGPWNMPLTWQCLSAALPCYPHLDPPGLSSFVWNSPVWLSGVLGCHLSIFQKRILRPLKVKVIESVVECKKKAHLLVSSLASPSLGPLTLEGKSF